jgi:hypothetical protein
MEAHSRGFKAQTSNLSKAESRNYSTFRGKENASK